MKTMKKEETEKRPLYSISRTFVLIAFFWTAVMITAGVTADIWEKDKTFCLTLDTARSFFQMIVTARYWNSLHGGVYVPVTEKTQPNPFLDAAGRDGTTDDGQRLTLINPGYMTRQLAEIATSRNNIRFHITSLQPIRPANMAYPWEEKALRSFVRKDSEYYDWGGLEGGGKYFRYMAPLWTESTCLKCHAGQGYKVGDLRGGISVSIPAENILSAVDRTVRRLNFIFSGIWFFGILGIYVSYRVTMNSFRKRLRLIEKLQTALDEIKTLKGLIPICASCKKVRTDSGYWEQIEGYISEHSDAEFTHSICPACMKKLYPDFRCGTGREQIA